MGFECAQGKAPGQPSAGSWRTVGTAMGACATPTWDQSPIPNRPKVWGRHPGEDPRCRWIRPGRTATPKSKEYADWARIAVHRAMRCSLEISVGRLALHQA